MAVTPGQVSRDADEAVRASTLLPPSVTWAATWSPASTAVLPMRGLSAFTRASAWSPACASTSGPVCPVTAASKSTDLPCTVRITATTSQPPASVVKPDFTPMTPSSPRNGV